MVFTIRRYSSFIGDKQAEECIPVKMRVIAAALGGPWEVLYLSQKSVSKKTVAQRYLPHVPVGKPETWGVNHWAQHSI